MTMRMFASYGAVAAATLAATVVMAAFDPDAAASLARHDWKVAVDWSVLEPDDTDDESPNERARLARRFVPG